MKQEDKDLLLKDLSARLPYGIKIKTEYFAKATLISIRKNISYGANKDLLVTYDISGEENPFQTDERISTISKIKPYLFPLSSMTEEQYEEFIRVSGWDGDIEDIKRGKFSCIGYIGLDYIYDTIDWFHKNHIDYRGLIPMGLAIDATNLNIY